MKKYIIDIVPITKIPLSRDQFFCYLHSEKITSGTLVSIPFSNRKVEGIVIGSRSDFSRLGNVKLKKVEKILEENFLDKNQIELANFISNHFLSPLGIVLKGFIPKRTKERKVKNIEKISQTELVRNIILTKEQNEAIKKIFKNTNSLLFGPSGSGKTEVYINAIKNLKSTEQALVLLPELTLSP